MEIFKWTKESIAFWALIVSLISLGWQIAGALQRRFTTAKLTAKVVISTLEITYGQIGLSFFLPLSYLSAEKSAFVDNVEVLVKNEVTNEQHTFQAKDILEYAKDPENIAPRLDVKEPFYPFGVTTESYHRMVILFYDPVVAETLRAELNKLFVIYEEILRKPSGMLTDEETNEFNSSDIVLQVTRRLQEAVYLKAGTYSMTVRTYVSGKVVENSLKFAMTQADYDVLTSNAFGMTRLLKKDEIGGRLLSVFPKVIP